MGSAVGGGRGFRVRGCEEQGNSPTGDHLEEWVLGAAGVVGMDSPCGNAKSRFCGRMGANQSAAMVETTWWTRYATTCIRPDSHYRLRLTTGGVSLW